MRSLPILFAALAVAACGPAAQTVRPAAIAAKPTPSKLGSVIGSDAKALTARFGAPAQNLSDGAVGKLQFAGADCVLDAYLYAGKVTHLDARGTLGEDADRAQCVASLTRAP